MRQLATSGSLYHLKTAFIPLDLPGHSNQEDARVSASQQTLRPHSVDAAGSTPFEAAMPARLGGVGRAYRSAG